VDEWKFARRALSLTRNVERCHGLARGVSTYPIKMTGPSFYIFIKITFFKKEGYLKSKTYFYIIMFYVNIFPNLCEGNRRD